jgi:hypothetical protein
MRKTIKGLARVIAVALIAAFVLTDGSASVIAQEQTGAREHLTMGGVGGNPGSPEEQSKQADEMLRSHPRGEALYRLAENGKHLAVTNAHDVSMKSAGGVVAVDPVTWDECAQHPNEEEGVNAYWFKNKFNICRRIPFTIDYEQKQGAVWVLVGRTELVMWLKGTGVDGSNSIDFALRMTDFTHTGVTLKHFPLKVELECINADPDRTSTCSDSETPPSYIFPVHEWERVAGQEFPFVKVGTTTAVPAGTHSAEMRGYFSTGMRFELYSDKGIDTYSWQPEVFRCDDATYRLRGSKCVFSRVASVLQFSESDTTLNESAAFIREAQTNITLTKPGLSGKRVPGVLGGAPLHRLYHGYDTKKTIAASRRKVPKTCRRYFGQHYTTRPINPARPLGAYECDEYPFAATYENSALVDSNTVYDYAVRAIKRDHNRAAGTVYGVWVGADRILDGDPFWVKIVP